MKTSLIFGLVAFAIVVTCVQARSLEEDNTGVREKRSPFWGKYWVVQKSAPPPPPPQTYYWYPKVIVVHSGPHAAPKKKVTTTTETPEPEESETDSSVEEAEPQPSQVVYYKSWGPKKYWG